MNQTLEEQIQQMNRTIRDMEDQRAALGDEVVDTALAPLQLKLDELLALLKAQEAHPIAEPTQQRKLVTLLFMDIVGSTSIAQDMDPEDVREVFDIALNRLAQPVKDHGGHVTRFMGDGFLAVFGAPTAHEDDPERAIRAGLAILTTSSELTQELVAEWGIPDFQVRIGINTGLVALGGLTEGEDTLMGAAVNLAARLESAAPPECLLISHDTYRHVRGIFDVEAQEPISAKGFDQPVQVYRVLRLKPRAFRTYTRGVEGVETKMVGRENELKYLQDALLNAIEEGEGQTVTISGEAGVGKSRLLYEFQNWIDLQPQQVRFFEGRGRLEFQNRPYGLLRDIFEFRLQIQDNELASVAKQKFVDGIMEVFGSAHDGEMRAHLLGQMLGFDFNDSRHLRGVLGDPEQLRNRGWMYLSEYFRELSNQNPVVIFMEDVHWADDSSLDTINWFGERMEQQRLLIICVARTSLFERRPYWGEGLAYHKRLELAPLSKRESRQLVKEIFKQADQLPNELRDLVVEGAEGNPFYLEELVKMLVEDQVIVKAENIWHVHPERLADIIVPPTLAGVLQARLDSLPLEERTVLQQASVVGRQFWDRVVVYIQAAGDGEPQIIPETLTSLRNREMIYRREGSFFSDSREYIFKHDILREVTYESVLKRLRVIYHGLVADWLISQGEIRIEAYSGLIAEHLLLAGREEKAGEYFLRAGNASLKTYANREAEVYFRKALELSSGNSRIAECLAGLGETLGRQGCMEEVDQTFHQAIELFYTMGDYDRVATLYYRFSQLLFHDDYWKAWQTLQDGITRLEGKPDIPGMALLQAEAGRHAFFRAQPHGEVVSICNQAIELAINYGVVEAQAEASITLALISDHPQESINILKEIAALSETQGLLSTSARAQFNLGYFYVISMGGAGQSYQHYMNSAEIYRQIGDIERMIMALVCAGRYWVSLGNLKSWEDMAFDFLSKSSATSSQIQECIQIPYGWVLYFRGEWEQAVTYFRDQLYKLKEKGSFQDVAREHSGFVNAILDLHRFIGCDNLSEAEDALLLNIKFKWYISESYALLAVVLVRKGHLQDAQRYLSDEIQLRDRSLTKEEEVIRSRAVAELAMAEERWDDGIVVCQNLIDIYKRGGYRWEWARQLIDLGDALVGRDGPEDMEKAQEAYHQSLKMFKEMGARGYIDVVSACLDAIIGKPSR